MDEYYFSPKIFQILQKKNFQIVIFELIKSFNTNPTTIGKTMSHCKIWEY